MLFFDLLAEQKIAAAVREGVFDDLPGAGRPIALDDDALVPEDVRAAYRILRNAGYLPPEVETRREVAGLRALINTLDDDAERRRASTRLALLEMSLETRSGASAMRGAYRDRLIARFSR